MVFDCTVLHIAVITFIFTWVSVEGKASTYIDCLDAPTEWQQTNLTCKVSGTVTVGIKYFRPNSGEPEEILTCKIDTSKCGTVGNIPEYGYVLDSSTQITFIIKSFNKTVDEGTWSCTDGTPPGIGDTICNKTVRSQTTTPQTGQTTAQQTGPGESLDWCIAVSAVLAVLIVVGIVILILVVKEPFDDKILKTLGIVLIVVGACVILTAVVTAILLAVKTNVDKTEASWIAAVVFCALGFLLGSVFCAVGVIKMSKLSKKDSKPVSGNSHELRNETGTPLNK